MEDRAAHDVPPQNYASVIRELIRHENDVTNHRIVWLLISQGFLANAYVIVKANVDAGHAISLAGILVTGSAFVMLYKSYQARGYLHFLGEMAKAGKLQERYLPLEGWPARRIKGWQDHWLWPWLERIGHLLEPYILLPVFSITLWTSSLLGRWLSLPKGTLFGIAFIIATLVISVLQMLLCRSQAKYEEEIVGDQTEVP